MSAGLITLIEAEHVSSKSKGMEEKNNFKSNGFEKRENIVSFSYSGTEASSSCRDSTFLNSVRNLI